jgi:hypothetical protein
MQCPVWHSVAVQLRGGVMSRSGHYTLYGTLGCMHVQDEKTRGILGFNKIKIQMQI